MRLRNKLIVGAIASSLIFGGVTPVFASTPVNVLSTSAYASATNIRVAGYDRYQTAVAIAKQGWTTSNYAIIAFGENYPDALAATPLAKKYDAPILLTESKTLNADTKKALVDLQVKNIIIVGGSAVVADSVKAELESMSLSVTRLAGNDRYDTAIKIAEKLDNVTQIAVVTGEDYADALSIGSIAGKLNMPVILTEKNSLPPSVKAYLASKNITKSYVVGDQDLISKAVLDQLPNVDVISGYTRYDKNIAILKKFDSQFATDSVCVATGEGFADALTGTAYAAKNSLPIILLPNKFDARTDVYISSKKSTLTKVVTFGGEAVVQNAKLGWYSGLGNVAYTPTPQPSPNPTPAPAPSASAVTPVFWYNLNQVSFPDAKPVHEYDGRNFFPLKEVATALGATSTDISTDTTTVVYKGDTYTLKENAGTLKNGTALLTTGPTVKKINGVTYIRDKGIGHLFYPNTVSGTSSSTSQNNVVVNEVAGVTFANDNPTLRWEADTLHNMFAQVPLSLYSREWTTNGLHKNEIPIVKEKVDELTAGVTGDYAKVKAIATWVADTTYYSQTCEGISYSGLESASIGFQAFKTKVGACQEYALLTAGMIKTLGLPVRVVSDYSHMWVETYIDGKWLMSDPTFMTLNVYKSGQFVAKARSQAGVDGFFDMNTEVRKGQGRMVTID